MAEEKVRHLQAKLDSIRKVYPKEKGRGQPAGLWHLQRLINPPPLQIYIGPDTKPLEVELWCAKAACVADTRQRDIQDFAKDTFL